MAMLECYELSLVARRVLEKISGRLRLHPEEESARTLRSLARPAGSDPSPEIGEPGVAVWPG